MQAPSDKLNKYKRMQSHNKLMTRCGVLILISMFILSCSVNRHIPEGDYLLNKNKLEIEGDLFSQKELQRYIRQKPNKKIFGFFRFHMGLFNLSSPDKESAFQLWLRKIGEQPVVHDPLLVSKSRSELKAFMNHKGYHEASVSDSIEYFRHKADVYYSIIPGEPYLLDEIDWSSAELISDAKIRSLVRNDSMNHLVSSGGAFDKDLLHLERKRITSELRNFGYYAFSKEYIFFRADTFPSTHTVNLELGIKNPELIGSEQDSVADHKRYSIRDIRIIGDFDPRSYMRNSGQYFNHADTSLYNDLEFITTRGMTVRKNLLYSSIYLEEGKLFAQSDVDKTYRSLAELKNFSPINLKFEPAVSISSDSIFPMDCQIELTPLTSQSYDVSVEGTHSSGNLGVAGNVLYNHRNLFRGAENFELKFKGAVEFLTNANNDFNRMLEFGIDSKLRVPQFWLPIRLDELQQKYNPRTFLSLNYNYRSRPEITRTVAAASFGYEWKVSNLFRHQLKIIDLNYVNVKEMSERFKQVIAGTYFEDSYRSHVIPAFNYTLTYSNQTLRKDIYFISFHPEIAGNFFTLAYKTARVEMPDEGYYFFDTPYAQYIMADIDFRYHKVLNPANRFAFRFFAGAGYPYGNADVLPFEKKYFSGGSNGIRAWQVRSLGPGSYVQSEEQADLYPNQLGDVKLEANFEYRFDLFWSLKGAVFLDAGNIWSIRPAADQPGSTFEFNNFYNEIAVGTGAGMRLDFSFFVLRLDLGMKLKDPGVLGGPSWIPFKRPYSRKDFVLNFAIGYPF
jgi:outer membrane protein assembly factor BamA